MQADGSMRQWVAVPGGSCDLRIGEGLIERLGPMLKGAVGRPRVAALVASDAVQETLTERVRRQLLDVGFEVQVFLLDKRASIRTLANVGKLACWLADVGVTADDLIVALGDADELALAASVAGAWCGGTTLAVIPTSLEAALSGLAVPRGIDVGDAVQVLAVRGCARYAFCDPQVIPITLGSNDVVLAYAEMAAGAMCESERAFATLWDRAAGLATGDATAIYAQLAASAKGRGQVSTSTSAAIRASGAYGTTFSRALSKLAPTVGAGVALAEGMRFCARVAVGMQVCSVDDMLAQDELIDLLGIGYAACEVNPSHLVEAIKAERFRYTNRLMLELPRALGRVRLATVEEGLLHEHVTAWCAARVS